MNRYLARIFMMNAVQKLSDKDIEVVEEYIEILEEENKNLKWQRQLLRDVLKATTKKLTEEELEQQENKQLKEQIKQRDEVIDEEQYVKIDFLIEMQKQITKAVGIAEQYAQIDGEHHKMWVIDQMLRELLGNNYNKWLEKYNYDSRENDYEEWNCGIAP